MQMQTSNAPINVLPHYPPPRAEVGIYHVKSPPKNMMVMQQGSGVGRQGAFFLHKGFSS